MIDVGSNLVCFAYLCRAMGGSTDVQFRCRSKPAVGGRSLLTCEQDGLEEGDAVDVYAQATVTTPEYLALQAMHPGLEKGVKVRVTYTPEAVVMLALAGAVPNDFGSLVEQEPGTSQDLRLIAKQAQSSLPRPALAVAESPCQCPPKPYWPPGSMVSGSSTEELAHDRWEAEHGQHPNAEAARNAEQ